MRTMDLENLLSLVQKQGMKLFAGLLVLVVGLFITHWINRLIARSEKLRRIDPNLYGFVCNITRLVLSVIVILTAAGVMGIPLTSFVTVLASAGVAISLAMQGALSNLVGGMIILLLKPLRVGDYVKIGDVEGSVVSIGAFYTELTTLDNRHISLPNSNITNTAIVNFSREGTRRLEIPVGVSYASDIDEVRGALTAMLAATPCVLQEPAPQVALSALQDSSVQFTLLFWCQPKDYWDAYYGAMEGAKRALDAAGIAIPFPQVDVHLKDN